MASDAQSAMLTSDEVAARLGVKVQTLYAYVSRGLIGCLRTPQGSRFEPLEVEEFAARRRSQPVRRQGRLAAKPLMVLDTDLAVVEDDELYLRGQPAGALARSRTVEEVAAWIWTGDCAAELTRPSQQDLTAAEALLAAMPAAASRTDQLSALALALSATDPQTAAGTAQGLQAAGSRFLLAAPAVLAHSSGGARRQTDSPADSSSVAEQLWLALSDQDLQPEYLQAINAALILTIDHDLAVSTLAGRIAASARGSGYAVLSAALGAFATPLHGHASHSAARLLRSIRSGQSPRHAVAEIMTSTNGRGVPGFGHFAYQDGDCRAKTLLELIPALPHGPAVVEAVAALVEEAGGSGQLQPNIDLALAALTQAAGMNDDDAPLFFALGRSVGWIAHAIAEYHQQPLRLRPQGRYTGP